MERKKNANHSEQYELSFEETPEEKLADQSEIKDPVLEDCSEKKLQADANKEKELKKTIQTEEVTLDNEETIRGGSRKDKLTPDKMKEREAFLRQFPQFANDDGEKGINGLEQSNVDVVSPALRPGWG